MFSKYFKSLKFRVFVGLQFLVNYQKEEGGCGT
jgi:hypothetical protein